jgi:hypothetical protein
LSDRLDGSGLASTSHSTCSHPPAFGVDVCPKRDSAAEASARLRLCARLR